METATNQPQHLAFQAEVRQLLSLMIHSLYSNREIFLRELVSNASDACDKLRFEALSDGALFEDDPEARIRVSYDRAARTLTVSDNGIGMSRQEVIENIGTIAKSGTREFFASLTGDQAKDTRLIGQFGVGFYSSFIVADRVTLLTRRAGLGPGNGVRWESTGEGDYTVETVEKKGRGTDVILHLREADADLLTGARLRGILRKYSDHIQVPILMRKEEWDKEARDYAPAGEEETVNQASALWARPRSEITREQYEEFYNHVAHDFEPPLAWVHTRVEGAREYTQLLYIPSRAQFDLWDRERRHGVKLYVQRVFIMDDAERLLPGYLRFVRGVIDSADLPLNVSREILQQSREIDAIRAGSVKKVLGLLEELARDEPEKYANFWREFGAALKEGLGEDPANRERIAGLCRFATTRDDSEVQATSLADYVAHMKPGQEAIYYVTADSFAAAKSSPQLEVFRRKGVEVLLLSDRVDEWFVANLPEFQGKRLQSVAKGDLDLGGLADEGEKKEQEAVAQEFAELVDKVKASLGERVRDVRVTLRLTDSPACLVADSQDLGRHLERMLRTAGQKLPPSRPVLEINPRHALLERLRVENEAFDDWAALLFEQALLAEGGQLEDPVGFVRRVNRLMLR
ncbi:MAG TPA: molecular chaperone HtpG [Burkholderiales bacterium]